MILITFLQKAIIQGIGILYGSIGEILTEKGENPGMVIEVLQKGYLLKDKVIRPAMVKVAE